MTTLKTDRAIDDRARPARSPSHEAGGTDRATNEAIADMAGPPALPRRSGELVFHDEWERRVFAMAVALCERGLYSWDDFREHLVAAIAAAGETPEHPKPDAPGYFEHWLSSFERVLADKDILSTVTADDNEDS